MIQTCTDLHVALQLLPTWRLLLVMPGLSAGRLLRQVTRAAYTDSTAHVYTAHLSGADPAPAL